MSADEIRKLANKYESNGNVHCIGPKEEEECFKALISYAAMVERCEKTRTQLELNKKDYANRGVCGSLVETNNDEIEMVDYILKGVKDGRK